MVTNSAQTVSLLHNDERQHSSLAQVKREQMLQVYFQTGSQFWNNPFTELIFHRDHFSVLSIFLEAGLTHHKCLNWQISLTVFFSIDASLWRSKSTHHNPTVILRQDWSHCSWTGHWLPGPAVPPPRATANTLFWTLTHPLSYWHCPWQASPSDATRHNFSLMWYHILHTCTSWHTWDLEVNKSRSCPQRQWWWRLKGAAAMPTSMRN